MCVPLLRTSEAEPFGLVSPPRRLKPPDLVCSCASEVTARPRLTAGSRALLRGQSLRQGPGRFEKQTRYAVCVPGLDKGIYTFL